MKLIFAAGSVAAVAALGLAAPASAAPSDAACFGQVHKTINAGDGSVGDLVKVVGGQGKKAIARGMC
jgi:hypothetical protein